MGELMEHFAATPSDVQLDFRKRYAKAVYKFVSGRTLRGKWGGSARRYAAPAPKGGLGMGRFHGNQARHRAFGKPFGSGVAAFQGQSGLVSATI